MLHQSITQTPGLPLGALDAAAARQPFAVLVGADFGAALREVARLKEEADAEEDEDRQEALDELRDEARDHVLAMPIRRLEDVPLKAAFAVRYCHLGDQLQTVLLEIVAFVAPELVDPIVPAEIF